MATGERTGSGSTVAPRSGEEWLRAVRLTAGLAARHVPHGPGPALAFVAIDIWGLIAQIEGEGLPIGHGAHLGGALTGIVYLLARGRRVRARARHVLP